MARRPVKSRQYFEAVEERLAQGIRQAEAINQVAEQLGLDRNVVRAGWYRYGNRRARLSEAEAGSFDQHIEQAATALEAAILALHQQVEDARSRLELAQHDYDTSVRSRDAKVSELQAQLAALRQHSDLPSEASTASEN